MLPRIRTAFRLGVFVSALAFLTTALPSFSPAAEGKNNDKLVEPITKGQRVLTCGHSFHVWVPDIVNDLCKKAEIKNHVQIGVSSIGGSRVIQHWDIADGKNQGKEALKTGKVDVLTLSPIFLPDAGIENFTQLAVEHNKDIRILVQPIWLRWDIYEPTTKRPGQGRLHNAISGEELRKRHEVYFQSMDEHIRELNKKQGKTVLYVVPAPQAVIAGFAVHFCHPFAVSVARSNSAIARRAPTSLDRSASGRLVRASCFKERRSDSSTYRLRSSPSLRVLSERIETRPTCLTDHLAQNRSSA